MNFLGKILIVLIFIMSIAFMVFSFMVYMTQTNWKDKEATIARSLSTEQNRSRELTAQLAELQTQREAENAARTMAISTLEARLSSSNQQLIARNTELNGLKAQEAQQGQQVTGSLATLKSEQEKVATLRETVKSAQEERDKMFKEVVDLKDKVLELEATRQRLSQRELALRDQVGRQAAVLRANDLSENDDITGNPPPRDGRVREVDGKNKYIVMSIGSDDGIQRGHKLDILRQTKFVGRVQVTKTHPDRSIGVIMPDYRKDAVRSGDRVRTR